MSSPTNFGTPETTRPDHQKLLDKTIGTHQTRPPKIDPPRSSSLFADGRGEIFGLTRPPAITRPKIADTHQTGSPKTTRTHQIRPPEPNPPGMSSLFEDGSKRLERKRKMKKKRKENGDQGRDGRGGKMKGND